MARLLCLLSLVLSLVVSTAIAAESFQTDVIKTSGGDLNITLVGHGTLIFTYNGKVIHVDPYGKLGDYAKLPKADMIVLTHEHQDHLDLEAINKIRNDKTVFVLSENCAKKIDGGIVLKNGDTKTVEGVQIEAVPAYNLVHMREAGQPFHPKGVGNGYVFTFGDKRIYVAGDTENTPEMKSLKNIDVAFLPMNLPYTMTPEMVADAAKGFKPKVLYPYHTGETDLTKLVELLKGEGGIEVRIRSMK